MEWGMTSWFPTASASDVSVAFCEKTVPVSEAFKGLTGPAWVDTMFFYRQKLIYAGR
jgi:hypothetical protein